MINRRNFLKKSAILGTGAALSRFPFLKNKTHILTLSFDDGFKKSFYRIAEIHENYGLKACLNVIATGHFKNFNTEPQWIPREILGNFDDWNTLKQRGHEIMPHTWKHLNLTQIPLKKAKRNIDKCLTYFEKHLEGYSSENAIYNFAYNASTPELEDHAMKRVRAVRTGGWLVLKGTMLNPIPVSELPARLGCWGHGPDFCDNYTEQEVNKFLQSEGGWLILNLHGLDNEGWGPVSTRYLDSLLKRLIKIDYLEVRPAGEVLQK
ncbi:MAG: polysaccharide deacetylase family protein [Bacteroidia bacterium]